MAVTVMQSLGARVVYTFYRRDGEKQTFGLTIVSRWIGELGDDGNTASLFATFSIFFLHFVASRHPARAHM